MPDFTPEQLHALSHRHLDACVVAGPGSGKTTVLVERFRSLIEEDHVDPRSIAAITFTEKAAANMKAKLLESFAHDDTRRRELESAWVHTIHGFCQRLLRENAIAAGIDPRFRVLDAREAERLQDQCLNEALNEFTAQRRPEALSLIETLALPASLIADLSNAWDAMRSAGISAEQARQMPDPAAVDIAQLPALLRSLMAAWPGNLSVARRTQQLEILDWARRIEAASPSDLLAALNSFTPSLRAVPPEAKEILETFREDALPKFLSAAASRQFAPYRAMLFDVLARFEALYAERKVSLGALDFNDLERLTISLLRDHPDIQTRVRAKFTHLMLDEFQDINPQQHDLIALIRAPDSFFGVGDINQSIYGFRHAFPQIFLDYEAQVRAAGKHSASLSHNFRSRDPILRSVQALLRNAPGIAERSLTAARAFQDKTQPSLEILRIEASDESEDREARWIAHRIATLRGTLQLTDKLADFRHFAILCRNSASMHALLRALDEAEIPWVCGRRESYLVSREGRDITALLHAIANPRDAVNLATVLRSPLCGLSDEALLQMRLQSYSLPQGLEDFSRENAAFTLSPDDTRKLERFARNLRNWRTAQPVIPPDLLISRALSDCGFDWLPGTTRADNIESYLHLARTRAANSSGNARDLNDFLLDVELISADFTDESDLADKDQGNRVQVMTAHASKGLEFPVIILANMDKGTRRESAAVSFTPRHGLGVKWKGAPKDIKDSWLLANAEDIKLREEEETHRLLYVAMTRAEEHLILSYTRGKSRPGKWARLVEDFFQLEGRPATNTLVDETISGLPASLLLADQEPPLVLAAGSSDAATPILAIPRPPLTGQHDSSVNVTALTAFAACPRRYYLERYLGWSGRPRRFDPEDVPADTDATPAAELGSQVHDLLALKPGTYSDEARNLAAVFSASPLGQRAATSPRSAREWDFILDLDGTLVSGSIDLWFEENGAPHIVDYKTDDVSPSDAPARAQHYAPQLALYAVALQRAFGRPPATTSLHFLRPNVVVNIPLPPDAASQTHALIDALRQAQQSQSFELNPSPACPKCPFFHNLCPAT